MLLSLSLDAPASRKKVLELEDPRIVHGQILIRVPRARTETLETAVPLETSPRRYMTRCVNLVGKEQIVTLCSFPRTQVICIPE